MSTKNMPRNLLQTGVVGLDAILGGGLPEYSFNLIAGGPGAGKTTLAQQIAFAQATVERPALYFTVLGEPALKMLRHVQQYSFFDETKFNTAMRYVNLSSEAMEQELSKLLDRIVAEIEEVQPGIVVVDSFRTITRGGTTEAQIQGFVQRLAIYLTSWEATTFLVGEYELSEAHNPIFTVADGILWLTQITERSSTVRQMQVTKSRGCAQVPGLHTFSISDDGIRVFPRVLPRTRLAPRSSDRAPTGIAGLDALMNGGIPSGDTAMVIGPSGAGKSTLARHFIAKGAEAGDKCVLAAFEEHPGEYLLRAESNGPHLADYVEQGLVKVLPMRLLDLSVEETLADIQDAVARTGARRLVIDSLSGFELALSPVFRDDFRESLLRMVALLGATGVTSLMTVSLVESFTELALSPYLTEFLADTLILLRYVELESRLEKVLSVVKMRSSAHSLDIRRYAIGNEGIEVGEPVHGYRGVMTGMPLLTAVERRDAGLTPTESAVLQVIREHGEGSAVELTKLSGVKGSSMTSALERLRQLGLILRMQKKGRVRYRRGKA